MVNEAKSWSCQRQAVAGNVPTLEKDVTWCVSGCYTVTKVPHLETLRFRDLAHMSSGFLSFSFPPGFQCISPGSRGAINYVKRDFATAHTVLVSLADRPSALCCCLALHVHQLPVTLHYSSNLRLLSFASLAISQP